ncbi:hypothetical protein [Lacticaseibacillus mingshuiensis]|uniref:hypothetical protein n=1 Tax=Lacticaseibacillus mingshuiensis TaxID=2799574 RepID=UPI001950035A|nr:hypothetical protein [Lacticaseibacillus mingshuiensis]
MKESIDISTLRQIDAAAAAGAAQDRETFLTDAIRRQLQLTPPRAVERLPGKWLQIGLLRLDANWVASMRAQYSHVTMTIFGLLVVADDVMAADLKDFFTLTVHGPALGLQAALQR